jgi:hypothetical protein
MVPLPNLTGGASGDSTAKGGSVGGAAFDNSGWNITFGNNSGVTSSRSGESAKYLPYVIAGGALLLALNLMKRKG